MRCSYRWMAPRVDAKTITVPVEHVCDREYGHQHEHHCPCGAKIDFDYGPQFGEDE